MKLFYDFLFIAGMLFSGIYIYILYKSKERGLSKIVLMILFTVLGFILLDSYAYIHKLKFLKYISLLPAHSSKIFLGPLLLLYIESLFFDDKSALKKSCKYFIPFMLFFIFITIPYFISTLSMDYLFDYTVFIRNNNQIIRVISDFVFLAFLVQSSKAFYKLKKVFKCNYSNIKHNNFIWVRYLLIAATVILVIDSLFVLNQMFFNLFNWRTQNIVMVLLVLSVLYAAYFGINQSKVLVPYFLLEKENVSGHKDKLLTEEQRSEFIKLELSLNKIMQEQKPYLDPELNLYKLASYLDTTDKKLSNLLNQHISTTFYNYINKFRLKEFKNRLQFDALNEITIEGIAYECGFKSKASFYRMFKKETGISPLEYIKSLK